MTTSDTDDPIVQQGLKQLRLFSLRDPLTERFGAEYFRQLPRQPGVYFFYGSRDELLYIGQSLDLRARIGSYRHVTPEKNPKRTLRLVGRIVRIEWEVCPTPGDAIERERVLLLEKRPPFNRAGVWEGDPWWLEVAARDGRVHLQLSRKSAAGIGPLPSAFRYAFGSAVRCLQRLAHPRRPMADYPHGLFGPAVPLALTLVFPDAEAAARTITEFAQGGGEDFFTAFEEAPPALTLLEQEYWREEIDALRRYATKWQRKAAAMEERMAPEARRDSVVSAQTDLAGLMGL